MLLLVLKLDGMMAWDIQRMTMTLEWMMAHSTDLLCWASIIEEIQNDLLLVMMMVAQGEELGRDDGRW